MVIAIHQPNFFPYFPFFQKMKEADVFVIMKHCQFEKNGYQNRFNIGDKWYTMSVNSKTQLINEKKYVDHEQDWRDIVTKLPSLHIFDHCINSHLATTNDFIIHKIIRMLDIKTRIVYDYPTELKGTARLVDLCKRYGATKYLSGISGKNYLDLGLFEQHGIQVIFQDESKMIKKPIIECLEIQ